MLDNLRNFGRSWTAKILIGLLIVAVAGFGLPSIFLDLGANTVARVGNQSISARDFDRFYRGQITQIAQQTGMAPTPQQAVAFGIPNAILAQLANEASVQVLADDLGLGASDATLSRLVRQDPNFASVLGLFDTREFTNMLRQSGYTENEYLGIQREVANREQIGFVFDSVPVPQVVREIAVAFDNDERTIEYLTLSPVLHAVFDEPSEAELTQFFEENRIRFRTVETRVVSVLPLTAEALAQGIEVSEAQIEAEYARIGGQFVAPERRTIHQLALPDDETAALFAQGLEAGRSFASLVNEAGLELAVNDVGTLAAEEIEDQAFAATVFALPENGFTLIEGPTGQNAIWVSAVIEEGPASLEDLREVVEQSAGLRAAQDMLFTVYDEIEEARAAFLPIADVAARYGLEVYDLALTRDGAALGEIDTLPPGSEQTIVTAVFNASPDARFTPAVNLGSNRTVFFTLEDIQPERDQTLDEVREEAIAAWQDLETDMALTRAAEDMVAALDQGGEIFTLAAEQGQFAEVSPPFTRNTAEAVLDIEVAQAAFQGGVGHAGYVQLPEGDVVIFQVTDFVPAQADAQSGIADALEDTFGDLLFSNFIEGLRQDQPIRINEAAINTLIGLE